MSLSGDGEDGLSRRNNNRYRYQAASAASAAAAAPHGEVHHGPETRARQGADHLQEVRQDVEYAGGGAGGGATLVFRLAQTAEGVRSQPLLVAAGGGGASDGPAMGAGNADAKGFLPEDLTMEDLMGLVPRGKADDAGE